MGIILDTLLFFFMLNGSDGVAWQSQKCTSAHKSEYIPLKYLARWIIDSLVYINNETSNLSRDHEMLSFLVHHRLYINGFMMRA